MVNLLTITNHAILKSSKQVESLPLSNLTPKQEKFAQLYVELGNASEAYRVAYNSKAKAESVNRMAKEQLDNLKISSRVQELREKIEEKSLWKRLDSIKTLASIADGTDVEAKPSDRVNAVKALNTMHGWDAPSKLDVTTAGQPITRIELIAPNDHSED